MATAYPFDPSGTSSANRIANEQHVITAQNFRDYHYVIPKFAPFFEANLSIRLQYPNGTVRNLTHGVDYYLSNQFLDASRATAKPVYGSISFLDTDTSGILSLSYNTVGGQWNLTPAEITRILAEEMRNPRTTTWEQITYLPERFPVIDHEWNLVDMVGASKMVEAIDQVRAAILSANGGGLQSHIDNYSNPHNVTKAQVGLGNVSDFLVATQVAAQTGTSNSFYMTPLRTKEAIAKIAGDMLTVHTQRVDNPHSVTKLQVGLGNVSDFLVATKAQAEAGAIDTAYMTPLKTANAISMLVGTAFNNHVANQLNPHNTTKAQVGLFNVENYLIATAEEARAGTANDRYMTPLRTTQLVTEFVTTTLDGHATRIDNPHSTTKEQVGLSNVENYGIATVLEAQTGASNVKYMTPGRTFDAIKALGTPASHLTDKNNPHEVTAEQIGTYTKTELDTAFADVVHIDDLWVAGKSKADFIAEVLTGTAANADKVYDLDFNQLLAAISVEHDDRYATTYPWLSRDKVTTPDPVATPYRWLKIGTVTTITKAATGSFTSIDTTHPDSYWFMTGAHKQEATADANAAAASPVYLIHAKNGLAANAHSFDVTRLNGASDSDVKFGYTYDAGTSTLSVWVRVGYAYNDVQVSRLTTIANDVDISSDATVVEPTGITYVDPVSYATTTAMAVLAQRVTDLESTMNSITVV